MTKFPLEKEDILGKKEVKRVVFKIDDRK